MTEQTVDRATGTNPDESSVRAALDSHYAAWAAGDADVHAVQGIVGGDDHGPGRSEGQADDAGAG